MTTPTTPLRLEYTGDSSNNLFPYTWNIVDKTHITVILVNLTTNVETTLTVDTDYTVNGVNSPTGRTISLVAGAPDSNTKVVIISNAPYSQEADFTNQNSVPPQEVENAIDALSIQIKQQAEELGRAIKATAGSGDDPSQIINQISADAAQVAADKATVQADKNLTEGFKNEAETARDEAVNAVGGLFISPNDTTAGNLESKLLVGTGLTLSTQNDGGNETRTITPDIASQAEAQAGTATDKLMTPERTAQAINELVTVNNDAWDGTDLAIDNGGTGASTASGARTNLDVYSKSEVDTEISNNSYTQPTAAGGVGTYAMLRHDNNQSTQIQFGGSNFIGSNPVVRPSSTDDETVSVQATLSGTWRCMGFIGNSSQERVTLWLRIA